MVPAPAKPSSTSFMTLAVFWTSLSMKSLAVKIGVVPPTMFGSWVGSSAAGVHQRSRIRGLADGGGLESRVDERHGRLRVAAGDRRLGAGERQEQSLRPRLGDAVHGVVGIVLGVVLRHGADHRAVGAGGG